MFAAVNGPMGGPADCAIRVGNTLEMQVSGIFADAAPKEGGLDPGFVVAAYGSPKLPRAGQWSCGQHQPASAKPRRSIRVAAVPIASRGRLSDSAKPRSYRDKPKTEYGFLMSTDTSRALFPTPADRRGPAGHTRLGQTRARRSVFAVPGVGRVSAGGVRAARTRGAGLHRRGRRSLEDRESRIHVRQAARRSAQGRRVGDEPHLRRPPQLRLNVDSANSPRRGTSRYRLSTSTSTFRRSARS